MAKKPKNSYDYHVFVTHEHLQLLKSLAGDKGSVEDQLHFILSLAVGINERDPQRLKTVAVERMRDKFFSFFSWNR